MATSSLDVSDMDAVSGRVAPTRGVAASARRRRYPAGGSAGPATGRPAAPDLHWQPLNWFGYLLLLAGPVALLLRTVYPYAVLLTVLAITVVYQVAGFGFGPIFVSLIVAFLTAATVGPRWRTYPLPVLGWVAVVWLAPLRAARIHHRPWPSERSRPGCWC